MEATTDPFSARDTLPTGETLYRIDRLVDPLRLPYTVCVLLENLLRRAGGEHVSEDDVRALAQWPEGVPGANLAHMPARVIMQDLTGVPAVVDLAAMRSAVARAGKDPTAVDPLVPVDLVIDHSVQVDAFGSDRAYQRNIDREFERNGERYALLRWAQGAFRNFRVVPPGMGIVHQVNLEYLGRVVHVRDGVAMPDTLVGTDSHTTMINALGVLGWGVGGIEAEAVMLGQPLYMTPPLVLGVRLLGALQAGVTATDLVLTITERLRRHGVVGKFVEFFGPGLAALTVAIGRRSRTCRRSSGPRPRCSRSTIAPSATCARPAASRSWSRWSSRTAASRACSAPVRRWNRLSPRRSTSTSVRSSRAWPARAGHRIACRWETCPRASRMPSQSRMTTVTGWATARS